MEIAILILLALLTIYVIFSYWSNTLSVLEVAEAGPVNYFHKANFPRVKPLTNLDKVYTKSELINIYEYQQFAIHGSCMEERQVYNGDIILSKMFKNSNDKEKKKAIENKERPLLVIYLYDKNYRGFKIREFSRFLEDNGVETFYYNLDGSRRFSSKPHKMEQIVGLVEYVISASTVSNKSEGEEMALFPKQNNN